MVSSRFKYSGRTWPLFGKNFEGVIGGVFNGVGGFAFGGKSRAGVMLRGNVFETLWTI